MYTQEQLERALALHTRLVHSGLDPDYAELRVLRALDSLGTTAVAEVAAEIVESAEERWKGRDTVTSGGKGNFFDELRRRIEAERSAKRRRSHDQRASAR
jgi:hypothetical protein